MPLAWPPAHGNREGDPGVGGSRGLHAAAAALVHRRADEPLHVVLDRHHARRRAPAGAPCPVGQWAQRHAGGPDRPPSPSLHPVLGLLNVCPVYERVGGHAYGSVYPGPIGAVLSPQLAGVEKNATLPYASSLCGACYDACPVKIDIPKLLVHLRSRHLKARRGRRLPTAEQVTMAAAAWAMGSPARWNVATTASRAGRALGSAVTSRLAPPPLSAWVAARNLPEPPAETFRQWWRRSADGQIEGE